MFIRSERVFHAPLKMVKLLRIPFGHVCIKSSSIIDALIGYFICQELKVKLNDAFDEKGEKLSACFDGKILLQRKALVATARFKYVGL